MLKSNRRTGKTTRMLEEAVKLANKHGYCFVVAANIKHQKLIATQLIEMGVVSKRITNSSKVKVYLKGGGQIAIETPSSVNLDWNTGQIRGEHPTCPVLADHFTIETNLSWAISQLDI